ncbi:MAG TPA: PspC domain-containing protein [Candidatus Paceibacterota bacterium]|nr:PspC domain-containing protein [Candidatus Paceibacterota bacterium]
MNKVTTINLNGRAYQIEEAGYEALRKYLDKARAVLAENPDKDEIMADFEQAVADKCAAMLSPKKNVVTAAEIDEIIAAMGPVDASGGDAGVGTAGKEEGAGSAGAMGAGAAGANAAAGSASANPSPKRLYRLPEGEWIAGVSTGLAAYFNIDVTVIRVLFVLLGVLTHGYGILAYVVLWIVMPVAHTEDEKARAHGVAPFNAHDFIEAAKTRYEEFREHHPDMPPAPQNPHDKASWKEWKERMKSWKKEQRAVWREERDAAREKAREERRKAHMEWRAGRHGWQNEPWENRPWQNRPWQGGSWQNEPGFTAGSGFFRFLMGLVIAALFVFCVMAIWSILHAGTFFGLTIAVGHSGWVAIVFVCALFYVLMLPFKVLMKNARPWHWGRYSFFNDLMQSLFFAFALYLVVLLGRELFPPVNAAYGMVVQYLQSVRW